MREKIAVALGHETTGMCYVASEALFHLTGGYDKWEVWRWRDVGMVYAHWYLRDRETGEWVDMTASQFGFEVPYAEGTKTGFLTKEPSKRTKAWIANRLLV